MANITTRTISASTVNTTTTPKGSALTHSEMDSNIINLNDAKLENTSDTFTGNLSVAGSTASTTGALVLNEATQNGVQTITIKSPASVGTSYTLTLPDTAGTSGQQLTTDGSGNLSWAASGTSSPTSSQSGQNFVLSSASELDLNNNRIINSDGSSTLGISLYNDVVKVGETTAKITTSGTDQDLTIEPNGTGTVKLGKDLDVNGQSIITTSNGDITLDPNGTGDVAIDTNSDHTLLEMHNAGANKRAGIIIHPNDKGDYTDAGGGTSMLYHTGIQIEEQGDYTYPAMVLKNNSINGYPYLWAAKAGPANRLTTPDYSTDAYMENNEVLFRYYGAPYKGDAAAGTEYYTAGALCDMKAAEDHSDGNLGCKIEFGTINTGSTSATTKMTIGNQVTMNSLLELQAYASGSLPTGVNGAIISISDNSYKPAYYDGSDWKYIADDSAV